MKTILLFLIFLPTLTFSQIKPGQKEDAVKIHLLIDFNLQIEAFLTTRN